MSIMEDKTILYSVRYPSAQEEGAHQGPGDRQAAEAKLTEFLRRMREERTMSPSRAAGVRRSWRFAAGPGTVPDL